MVGDGKPSKKWMGRDQVRRAWTCSCGEPNEGMSSKDPCVACGRKQPKR